MKKINLQVIVRKDTPDKVRADALNKIIDEKIQSTPELTARNDEIVQAKTMEEKHEDYNLDNGEWGDALGLPTGGN